MRPPCRSRILIVSVLQLLLHRHLLTVYDETAQAVEDLHVLRTGLSRHVEEHVVASIISHGGVVPYAMLLEIIYICLHAALFATGDLRESVFIALEFKTHLARSRKFYGLVETRVRNLDIEEMIRLLVCDVETVIFPRTGAACPEIRNP